MLASVACCLAVLVAATAITTRGAQDVPDYLAGQQPLDVAQPAQVGNNLRPIAIIGDSLVRNFAVPFQDEATRMHRASFAMGFGGCATGDLPRVQPNGKPLYGAPLDTCYKYHYLVWTAKVVEMRPEIVFVHSRRDGYDLQVDGKHLRAGTPEWLTAAEAEWDRNLQFFLDHGATTMVLILPLFKTGESPHCESGRPEEARVRRCGGEPDGFMGAGPLRAAYRHWAAQHTDRVHVVDLVPWVCPSTRSTCPKLIEGKQMRIADGIHFTDAGQAWIVPKIFEASGVFNR
jgi:hypothetical protein